MEEPKTLLDCIKADKVDLDNLEKALGMLIDYDLREHPVQCFYRGRQFELSLAKE